MAVKTLTEANFDETINRPGIVLVDFWAEWCGPCKQFAPIFEDSSTEHLDILYGKVDTESETNLAQAAEITAIPTLMIFRDGVLVFSQPGALAKKALEEVVQAIEALDMNKVKQEIADYDKN